MEGLEREESELEEEQESFSEDSLSSFIENNES